MHLHITRDSVCAADDVDPGANSRQWSVDDDLTVESIVAKVWCSADLPQIAGGEATWCISSNQPLAIVAQQWDSPKLVQAVGPAVDELDIRDDGVWFHVSYFAQQNPEIV